MKDYFLVYGSMVMMLAIIKRLPQPYPAYAHEHLGEGLGSDTLPLPTL